MRDNIMHQQMHTLDSPSVITFSTERPRMLVSWSFIAQNAPTESCRCTTRIPWHHQNPAYTHRILFALTAWACGIAPSFQNVHLSPTFIDIVKSLRYPFSFLSSKLKSLRKWTKIYRSANAISVPDEMPNSKISKNFESALLCAQTFLSCKNEIARSNAANVPS